MRILCNILKVPSGYCPRSTESDRNEPIINAAFAEYYGCAAYHARVSPKEVLVENAVKLLYCSVYFSMKGISLLSLDEFNTAFHIPYLASMKR